MEGKPRVTVSGDRAGHYVIEEERADGSLVLTPDPAPRPAAPARRRPPSGGALRFPGLGSVRRRPSTVPEILADWGIELGRDERVREFLVAKVDGQAGFVAVTSERFVFAAHQGRSTGVSVERRLRAVRGAEVVKRGRSHQLIVRWEAAAEMVISGADRGALQSLASELTCAPRLD
jgi:hypothetical protein